MVPESVGVPARILVRARHLFLVSLLNRKAERRGRQNACVLLRPVA